ncbi:MAG: PGPGW domain-containing protein [Actinobacteria bacterium]|nr:PGPGW domain-containing protein [Actinomycetota bacterium]
MEDAIRAKRRPLIIRAVVVIAGTVLVLGGVIGLLLPVVPGWLLIIPGLAILGTEFVWAATLLDSARTKAWEIRAKVPTKRNRAA